MEKSRNYSPMLCFSVTLIWFLQLGFNGVITASADYVPDDEPYVLYCSQDMYFRGDRDLRASIAAVLQNLIQVTAAPGGSEIQWGFHYPADDPHVYGASFCQSSDKPADCGRCLRMARNMLLHGCSHGAGAEFYSELCYLRFEFYNFDS